MELLQKGIMTCSANFVSESTPLQTKATSTTVRHRRFPLARTAIAYLSVAIFFFVLSRQSSISRNIHTSSVVEEVVPQKLVLLQPSPAFYLPALNGKKIRKEGLRWGILGLGRIAHDFTSALIVSGCNVTAVASSSATRSESFANHFSISTHYSSYKDLASDPNVDIVYIATTNNNHKNPILLMLQNGKNVLVEKPTTVAFDDAKIMYEEARKRGLFLMTNHWTRFFPLIKYLRQNFLRQTNENESINDRRLNQKQSFRLGKVMAMHGDFSFPTPLSPSDRFLNRTLGGGVTLDVGCYLIELALLAAYDHYNSSHSSTRLHGNDAANVDPEKLHPDGIDATGHGIMYTGLEFPVDVESSFSLRWGGGSYGVWNGECENSNTDSNSDKCESLSVGGRGVKTLKNRETAPENSDQFTMIASFQASFRRPSTFEVEYVFEYGRIVIAGPGNCPNEMAIYEYEPYGPLKREAKVSYPLPPIKNALVKHFGVPNYPRAEGFAYVIDAIEECMAAKGVPGRDHHMMVTNGGCLEMEENTIEEQLVTVQATENVLIDMGYFRK